MIESGAIWQHRNDVRIPNVGGTFVSLDEFDNGPFFHHRIEARYWFNNRHSLRLLWAPFEVSLNGVLAEDVNFDGTIFTANQSFQAKYKFNSYRMSYIYSFFGDGDRQLNLGITAKVRDAEIAFEQNGVRAAFDNIGFVPLIYFEFQTPLTEKWFFNLNLDGAAAPQGRAFDVALKLRRRLSSTWQLGVGLRALEGGADNDEVLTFSWFNYAVVDLTASF